MVGVIVGVRLGIVVDVVVMVGNEVIEGVTVLVKTVFFVEVQATITKDSKTKNDVTLLNRCVFILSPVISNRQVFLKVIIRQMFRAVVE